MNKVKNKNGKQKYIIITILALMLLLCTSQASAYLDHIPADPEYTITDVHSMSDLKTAIDNTSVINFSDGYYTVHKYIQINSSDFIIHDDIKLDMYSYLLFNSDVTMSDGSIAGYNFTRRYTPRGYVTVNGNIEMNNFEMKDIGNAECDSWLGYNYGLYLYGSGNVSNSIFNYVYAINADKATDITFTNNVFTRSNVRLDDPTNINFIDNTFDNSWIKVSDDYHRSPQGITTIENCSFTDTHDRPDGDGHYSGVYGTWAYIRVYNSSFTGCGVYQGDRSVIVDNSVFEHGYIYLSSTGASRISNNTIANSSYGIYIYNGGDYVKILNNTIYGHSSNGIHIKLSDVEKMLISGNEIYSNGASGIYFQGSHDTYHPATISNNFIHDNALYGLHTWGNSRGLKNIFTNNIINDDVSMSDRDNLLEYNTIDGNVTVSNNRNWIRHNQITGSLNLTNLELDIVIFNNTASEINVIKSINLFVESCITPIYNLFDNSNDNLIVTSTQINVTTDSTITNLTANNNTYTFNGSSYLQDNNLVFSVLIGGLYSINVSGLNGTYDLFKDSNLISTVDSIDDSCLFEVDMHTGDYLIVGNTTTVTPDPTEDLTPEPTVTPTPDPTPTEAPPPEPTVTPTPEPTEEPDVCYNINCPNKCVGNISYYAGQCNEGECNYTIAQVGGECGYVTPTAKPTPTPEIEVKHSSSSKGGSGGSSGESNKNIETSEAIRQLVVKDSTVTFSYKKDDNPIESITFMPLNSMDWVISKIEILKDTSTLVSTAPPNEIYKNLNIWVGNYGQVTESNTDDIVISFSVDKSWITENDINPDTITLNHYTGDSWHKLNTIEVSNTQDRIFFEAVIDSFSPFAITGTKNTIEQTIPTIKPTQEPTNEPVVETVDVPQKSIFKTIIKWFKSYKWW